MWNFIKGIFLIAIGLICIAIPVSCVINCTEGCRKEAEITRNNTQIEFYLEGPEKGDQQWGDGRVTNYAKVGFKNVGRETIYRVTCDVLFYDAEGKLMGTEQFNYDPAKFDPIEYGETSPYFVLSVTSREGKVTASVKIKDLKVNGYDKVSGYE